MAKWDLEKVGFWERDFLRRGNLGFRESGILRNWDFGKVRFGKLRFWESVILGKCDFGKVKF